LMVGGGIPPGVNPQHPDGVVDNRVMVVEPGGGVIWQYGQFGQTGDGPNFLNTPVQCAGLPHSQFLITDQGNNRVIQVNWDKQIVWQYPGANPNAPDQLNHPSSAQALENGDVLIADGGNRRALQISRDGVVVKIFSAGGTIKSLAFASRLED